MADRKQSGSTKRKSASNSGVKSQAKNSYGGKKKQQKHAGKVSSGKKAGGSNKRSAGSGGGDEQTANENGSVLLSTAEVVERFQVSRRTVGRWRKNGLKSHSKPGSNANHFREDDIREFLSMENRKGKRTMSKSQQAPVVSADDYADSGGNAGGGNNPQQELGLDLDSEASGTDLKNVMRRLREAEQATHQQYMEALDANKRAADNRRKQPYTAAALNDLLNNWKNIVETRRKFEKDLPSFLLEHKRYVDIEYVCEVVSRVLSAVDTDLDQLGMMLAPQLVGLNEGEMRVKIDDETKNAKTHIREIWDKISNS